MWNMSNNKLENIAIRSSYSIAILYFSKVNFVLVHNQQLKTNLGEKFNSPRM